MKLKKINKYYLGMGFFSSNKYIKSAGIKNLLAFLEKKAVFSQVFDLNAVISCCENENDLKKKFSDLSKEFKLKGAFFSPENLLEKVFFYFNESDLINFKLNNALIENFVLEKMALN